MAQESVLVVGAGGFALAMREAVELNGRQDVVGFVDDRSPILKFAHGRGVLGRLNELPALRRQAGLACVAIGDNTHRERAYLALADAGFEWLTVLHPSAAVSPSAVIGKGVCIMAGCIVGAGVRIGDGVIVNAGAVLDHHVEIDSFAHIGVGACIGGEAFIGRAAWVREGAVVRRGQAVEPGGQVSR